MEARAFYGCHGLSSVTIPNSVTSIGGNPFIYCSGLRIITVANGNPKYDSRESCNAIIETATNKLITGCQRTTIPASVTSIGDAAFCGCSALSSFTIPSSVTSIGNYAYEGCDALLSVVIPKTVTSIGDNPFDYCWALKSIKVESGNPNYDSRDGCNAIIETASNRLISGCSKTTIPPTVTALGKDSFAGCTDLVMINIPNTVTSIEKWAFYGSGLRTIDIPNSISVIEDCVFSRCSELTSVTLPNTITRIGTEAFYYCETLSSIDMPASVTHIGVGAFYYCEKLSSIDMPASLTYIGADAFYSCTKLSSIDIPASVTYIGESAFEESGLADVYSYIKSPANVTVGENAFRLYSPYYKWRTLHVPAGKVAAYKADTRWSDYFGKIEEMPGEEPGDVNGDGSVNISDVNAVIDAILGGSFDSAADVNSDGAVNISDVNAIIAIILK